jgi:hypothetical protein
VTAVDQDPSPAHGALPADALVLGPRDALVVLGLRLVRRTSLLVIPLGATVALLAGTSQDNLATRFTSISGFLDSLLSPLWLLAIGVALRVAVAPLAYLAAFVVAAVGPRDVRQTPDARGVWSRFNDLFRVAGGLRALRWTIAVRDEAVTLGGPFGRLLRRLERLLAWLIGVAWALFVVTVAVRTD